VFIANWVKRHKKGAISERISEIKEDGKEKKNPRQLCQDICCYTSHDILRKICSILDNKIEFKYLSPYLKTIEDKLCEINHYTKIRVKLATTFYIAFNDLTQVLAGATFKTDDSSIQGVLSLLKLRKQKTKEKKFFWKIFNKTKFFGKSNEITGEIEQDVITELWFLLDKIDSSPIYEKGIAVVCNEKIYKNLKKYSLKRSLIPGSGLRDIIEKNIDNIEKIIEDSELLVKNRHHKFGPHSMLTLEEKYGTWKKTKLVGTAITEGSYIKIRDLANEKDIAISELLRDFLVNILEIQ
jgi:hypothetical protein